MSNVVSREAISNHGRVTAHQVCCVVPLKITSHTVCVYSSLLTLSDKCCEQHSLIMIPILSTLLRVAGVNPGKFFHETGAPRRKVPGLTISPCCRFQWAAGLCNPWSCVCFILNVHVSHRPQVVTFHNQRDFVFVRHHRYIFAPKRGNGQQSKEEHQTGANIQELGPRFTLRLKWLQEGTFNTQFGEFEWILKRKEMEPTRRTFNL